MYRPTILLLPNTLYRLLKRKVENCICDTRVVKMRYNKTNNDLYVLTQENYQRKYSRLLNVFTSRSNSSDEGQLARPRPLKYSVKRGAKFLNGVAIDTRAVVCGATSKPELNIDGVH
jgi:hypothetical protein